MDDEDLAYDGSNGPQKRELTARERDILSRVITEILGHARRNPPVWNEGDRGNIPFVGWDWTPTPISIGEPTFFKILWEIRRVIDPRVY